MDTEISVKTGTDDGGDDDDLPLTARDVAVAIRTSCSQWNEDVVSKLVTLLGRSTADNNWQKVDTVTLQ